LSDTVHAFHRENFKGLQIWRVVAIVLTKQSRTEEKGWSSKLEVWLG